MAKRSTRAAAGPDDGDDTLPTVDLQNVELIRTGTFETMNGRRTVTTAILEAVAEAYRATAGKLHPRLKIGHAEDDNMLPEGMPAIGWVENIRRVGDTLVGDILKVPRRLYRLMQAGAYRPRSVEIRANYEVDGRTYPWVLTGLALLGADLPAVKDLADVEGLYREPVLCFSEVLRMSGSGVETPPGAGVPSGHTTTTATAGDRPMDLKKLCAALGLGEDGTEEQCLAKIKALREQEMRAGTQAAAVTAAEAKATDAAARATAADARVTAAEARATTAEAKVVELQASILAGQAASQARDKAALVDGAIAAGKFLPAQRTDLIKLSEGITTDALKAVLDKQAPVVDLSTRGGTGKEGEAAPELTAKEREVARLCGLDPAQVLEGKKLLAAKSARAT